MTPNDRSFTDTTLQDVTDRLDAAGYAGQFRAEPGSELRCLTCRQTFAASSLHADDVLRLEGASDPGEMTIVIALVCPHCETKGTLVARYGPEASLEEADVLAAVERTPHEGSHGLTPPGVG